MKYCEYIHKTKRFPSREVKVGNIGIGASNPIRIQSMTSSSTCDVDATVAQIVKLADTGCDLVRITVQGMKEAHACEGIKNTLIQKGYDIPLVADIHFYPPAAMTVIDYVDKVRINPGNFIDKRATFKTIDYDNSGYHAELEKIEEKFAPLVLKCKRLGKAMRIGTNHGSLSDRIMSRYGDTAQGMVESALEFTRVCRKYDFHDIIFSMKASNTHVMIHAYRLLVAAMYEESWDYPLHLGVTEAGEGEDGRVRSAIGIGSLLMDGIGDTIRVSLTEDPWKEVPPCQRLVNFAQHYESQPGIPYFEEEHRAHTSFQKRESSLTSCPFLHRNGSVITHASANDILSDTFFKDLGIDIGSTGTLKKGSSSVDAIFLENMPTEPQAQEKLEYLRKLGLRIISTFPMKGVMRCIPLKNYKKEIPSSSALCITDEGEELWEHLPSLSPQLILLSPHKNHLHYARRFFEYLQKNDITIPVILSFEYEGDEEDTVIAAAAEIGALLCDGIGDGIMIKGPGAPLIRRIQVLSEN